MQNMLPGFSNTHVAEDTVRGLREARRTRLPLREERSGHYLPHASKCCRFNLPVFLLAGIHNLVDSMPVYPLKPLQLPAPLDRTGERSLPDGLPDGMRVPPIRAPC